ncbi:MAG: class I SAM-dependent methyltransferase [Candidatus Bathyarchaeales archaeon]
MSASSVKAIRSYWDRRAHIYAEVRKKKEWFKKVDQRVSDLIDASTCSLILDIGTGPAIFPIKIAKANNAIIVGVDISKRSLKIAKNQIKKEKLANKIHLITATADALPFQENSFAAVTSILTIHHLPPRRMENSFKEFSRVLKLKGKLVLVEDWASEPRTYFQQVIYKLRKILMRSEIEEYHTTYCEYVAMIERSGLKIFAVEFHPRQVDLARFEVLNSPEAHKLLEKAEKIEQHQQTIDTTFLGAVKPALYRTA